MVSTLLKASGCVYVLLLLQRSQRTQARSSPLMASKPRKPSLHERVPLNNTVVRVADLLILSVLLCLLGYRLASLRSHGPAWFVAFICECWFTFVWFLSLSVKRNQVIYTTFPHRLTKQYGGGSELPPVDLFVTTADPKLEPPIITVNTVLSLLAVEYPVGKLACYVSDDGGSAVTFYSLVQAANFARLWVPFCNKYDLRVRAPSVYFSAHPEQPSPESSCSGATADFIKEWTHVKKEYEELSRRIERASEENRTPYDHLGDEDSKDFLDIDSKNHPAIIKVIWENKEGSEEEGLMPHLIYLARERRPKHPHHFKAGAMNVLTRVSSVMTNAPFVLNVDCDMFASNPQVVLHAMCLLLGFDDEVWSGFVQVPQRFHGGLEDDPFGNQMVVLSKQVFPGLQGIQGPIYAGTGCFHRRKVIYGSPPNANGCGFAAADLSREGLEMKLGDSKELIESTKDCNPEGSTAAISLSTRIEAAHKVASSAYEFRTSWGEQVGWVYGSMTEDVLTGLRCHSMGWRSAAMILDPPGFLGSSPTGGPASLTQHKRWATGLLEILVSKRSPLVDVFTKKLMLRQCLGYLFFLVWPVRSLFELCYALLPAYCLLADSSFLPKTSELGFVVPFGLFVIYNAYTLAEYRHFGMSLRAWWNNQRMFRIYATTSWLLGFFSVVLKALGISQTIFDITRKDDNKSSDDGDESRRFTFDSSPVFVPGTAIALANLSALLVGVCRLALSEAEAGNGNVDGAGAGEMACLALVVLCFWPFVKGVFVGRGRFGIPWVVICKAAVLVGFFLQMCAGK